MTSTFHRERLRRQPDHGKAAAPAGEQICARQSLEFYRVQCLQTKFENVPGLVQNSLEFPKTLKFDFPLGFLQISQKFCGNFFNSATPTFMIDMKLLIIGL